MLCWANRLTLSLWVFLDCGETSKSLRLSLWPSLRDGHRSEDRMSQEEDRNKDRHTEDF